jgi:membrane associated rhomboid family serine protease
VIAHGAFVNGRTEKIEAKLGFASQEGGKSPLKNAAFATTLQCMLEDRNYMRRRRFESWGSATVLLIILNVVAFIVQCAKYGYPPNPRPGDYFALSVDGLQHGYVWQLVTFQFMHGGVLHLLLNCLAIFMFGREVEQTLGRRRYFVLYFASGIIGGLFQAACGLLFDGHFAAPVVGASAGAFGLIAAFATLFPERSLVLLVFYIIPVTMRAKFLLLFSALLAVFGIIFPVDNIANGAHLGGMLTGMVFIRFASRWQWSSFQRRREQPKRLVKVPILKAGSWARPGDSVQEELGPEEFLAKEVDPILDKISAYGIQSLTERERRILETARTRMGKR